MLGGALHIPQRRQLRVWEAWAHLRADLSIFCGCSSSGVLLFSPSGFCGLYTRSLDDSETKLGLFFCRVSHECHSGVYFLAVLHNTHQCKSGPSCPGARVGWGPMVTVPYKAALQSLPPNICLARCSWLTKRQQVSLAAWGKPAWNLNSILLLTPKETGMTQKGLQTFFDFFFFNSSSNVGSRMQIF